MANYITVKKRFKARIQAEGRWDLFVERREALVSEGMDRRAAWQQAMLEFPPLDGSVEEGPSDSQTTSPKVKKTSKARKKTRSRSKKVEQSVSEEPQRSDMPIPGWCNLKRYDFRKKNKTNLVRDVDWAIENASFPDIRPKDAPSGTAWLYLQLFRQDRYFLQDVLKRKVPSVTKVDQDKGFQDDGRDINATIDRCLEEIRAAESADDDAVLSQADS
jgi:hypothetical protein